MENIAIVGAGGFGREVYSFINKEKYNVVGFIDIDKSNYSSYKILGDDTIIPQLRDLGISDSLCIAIGDMKKRERIFNLAKCAGLKIPCIIHESAQIFTEIDIGEGTIIYPNVSIMTNCKIDYCVLVNAGVTIGHDSCIGSFSNINPGVNLAGKVIVGEKCLIGLGTSVKEKITIGSDSIIGAGSVIVKDIPSNKLVYGIAASIKD